MPTILRSLIYVAVFLGLGPYTGGDSVSADETSKATAPSQDSGGHAYTNRLIHSNDPYLLLHAHNPVDWYPWGAEALARAKRENKPIFSLDRLQHLLLVSRGGADDLFQSGDRQTHEPVVHQRQGGPRAATGSG